MGTPTDLDDPTAGDRAVLERALALVRPPSAQVRQQVRAAMDQKVKPPGSLGRLEELAGHVAAVRRTPTPGRPTPAVVVCAADHGVAAEGVSAYPVEVTGLMLASFASGGAAVCVLSEQAGARLVVADLGVAHPPPACPGGREVLDLRVRAGTRNSASGPAMTSAEAHRAVRLGIDLAGRLVRDGVDVVALGEMGIGNTTTASAVTAALLGVPASRVCGPGTGLGASGVAHKTEVVERVLARHAGLEDPMEVLAAMGGLEVAALTGLTLGCAARSVPVVVDGFITGAAALVAARLAPASAGAMLAGHRSTEPGHTLQLAALGLHPLLELDLRLGEGSGAALALGLVRSALALLDGMATFQSLGLGNQP